MNERGQYVLRGVGSDPQAEIRDAIKRRRRTLGLTQIEAADLLGVHRLVYHRMENGQRRLTTQLLALFCAAFHCSIDDLIADPSVLRSYRALSARVE